jgi:hypothetical protein
VISAGYKVGKAGKFLADHAEIVGGNVWDDDFGESVKWGIKFRWRF